MINKIISWLNQLTYKLGVVRQDQWDIGTFSFWYKQLFHLSGGFILAAATGWIDCVIPMLMAVPLSGYLILKELDDTRGGQPIEKGILDIVFWMVGLFLGTLLYV